MGFAPLFEQDRQKNVEKLFEMVRPVEQKTEQKTEQKLEQTFEVDSRSRDQSYITFYDRNL